MSPPPSPLFPLGGRPCLSTSHTLTVCPCQACVRVWGVQPRSERPALPRRAARIRGGPSCDSKMKALLSKQYRTTRVDPLHSYLATNRILQLIDDIACIYEREGSVKLAARRGTKRSSGAKSSSLFQRLNRLLTALTARWAPKDLHALQVHALIELP